MWLSISRVLRPEGKREHVLKICFQTPCHFQTHLAVRREQIGKKCFLQKRPKVLIYSKPDQVGSLDAYIDSTTLTVKKYYIRMLVWPSLKAPQAPAWTFPKLITDAKLSATREENVIAIRCPSEHPSFVGLSEWESWDSPTRDGCSGGHPLKPEL